MLVRAYLGGMVYMSPGKREEIDLLMRGLVLAQMRRQQKARGEAMVTVEDVVPSPVRAKPALAVIEGGLSGLGETTALTLPRKVAPDVQLGRGEIAMDQRRTGGTMLSQRARAGLLLVDGDNPEALDNRPVSSLSYEEMPIAATLHSAQGTVVWLGGIPQPTGKEVLENPRRQMAAFVLGQIMRVNEGQPASPVAAQVDAWSVAQAAFVGAVAEKHAGGRYPGMTSRSHALNEVLGFVDDVATQRVSVHGDRANAQGVWDSFEKILDTMSRLKITPYDLYSVALERKQEEPKPMYSPYWLKPGYDEKRDHRRPVPKHAKSSLLSRMGSWFGGKPETDGFDWVPDAGR